MKKFHLAILFLLISYSAFSQNLVQNGSFEMNFNCPSTFGQTGNLMYWQNTSEIGSPDYFNACNTNICNVSVPNNHLGDSLYAHNGSAYIGLHVRNFESPGAGKEYLMIELNEDLIENESYTFSFYARRAPAVYGGAKVQAHLSQEPLSNEGFENIDLTPNLIDTDAVTENEWTKYSTEYTSDGTEKYLTIGNFESQESLDSTVVIGLGEYSCLPFEIIAAYYLIDDVYLTITTSITETEPDMFKIAPNPINDGFLKITGNSDQNNTPYNIEIFDHQGKSVFEYQNYRLGNNIDLTRINDNGVFYLRMIGDEKSIIKKILIL